MEINETTALEDSEIMIYNEDSDKGWFAFTLFMLSVLCLVNIILCSKYVRELLGALGRVLCFLVAYFLVAICTDGSVRRQREIEPSSIPMNITPTGGFENNINGKNTNCMENVKHVKEVKNGKDVKINKEVRVDKEVKNNEEENNVQKVKKVNKEYNDIEKEIVQEVKNILEVMDVNTVEKDNEGKTPRTEKLVEEVKIDQEVIKVQEACKDIEAETVQELKKVLEDEDVKEVKNDKEDKNVDFRMKMIKCGENRVYNMIDNGEFKKEEDLEPRYKKNLNVKNNKENVDKKKLPTVPEECAMEMETLQLEMPKKEEPTVVHVAESPYLPELPELEEVIVADPEIFI